MSEPKQTGAGKATISVQPIHAISLAVGDLCGRVGGQCCPAHLWPAVPNRAKSFAAAFAGVSESFIDARRPKDRPGPVKVIVGGEWTFGIAGPVKKDDPLGPYVRADGSLDPQKLRKCEPDEAVGVAKADSAGETVAVVLNG